LSQGSCIYKRTIGIKKLDPTSSAKKEGRKEEEQKEK
jgi:hypothetical protein